MSVVRRGLSLRGPSVGAASLSPPIRSRIGASLGLALQYAAIVFVIQCGCAYALQHLKAGARSEAAGVCLSTLAMIVSGFVLGLRVRRQRQRRILKSRRLSAVSLRVLEAEVQGPSDALFSYVPKTTVALTAVLLAALGALAYSFDVFVAFLPPNLTGSRGVARAMFATDMALFPSLSLVVFGAGLGVHARPKTGRTVLLALGVLALLVLSFAELGRQWFYDEAKIALFGVAGAAVALLLTGFLVSWMRRSLAFVELSLVALLSAYLVYMGVVLGPDSLISASNIPKEQILLALSLVPATGFLALLFTGGSVAFLLFGGGRFDSGFYVETKIALRMLALSVAPRATIRSVLAFFAGGADLVLRRIHPRARFFKRLAERHGQAFVGVVTVIAVLGVAVGVSSLIIVLSIMSGFEDDLKRKILGANAHIVVGKNGDDFTEYGEVRNKVAGVDGVKTAAAFVLGDGMISSDVGLSGTLVKGIDARSLDATRDLRKTMEKGDIKFLLDPELIPGRRTPLSYGLERRGLSVSGSTIAPARDFATPVVQEPKELRARLPGIVIGRELARALRAYVGGTVKLVSPASEEIGPLGPTPKLRRFRVAGIFYSGMYEYDAKFSYMDIKQAQRFFGKRKRVSGIEVKVGVLSETARIVEELKRKLGGFPYRVKDWRSMNKELFSALLLEKLAMFIALAMIVVVASFLIVSILVMIVLQRGKEIAILKSIGISDSSITKIFVVQGMILGVGGTLFGVVLGIVVSLLLGAFVKLSGSIFYIEHLPVVMDWAEILVIAVAAVLMSYLATIYPAMIAAQLRPVEGLRDD